MQTIFGILGAVAIIWGVFRVIGIYRVRPNMEALGGYDELPNDNKGLQLPMFSNDRKVLLSMDAPSRARHSEEWYFYTGAALIGLGLTPVAWQLHGHVLAPKLQALALGVYDLLGNLHPAFKAGVLTFIIIGLAAVLVKVRRRTTKRSYTLLFTGTALLLIGAAFMR